MAELNVSKVQSLLLAWFERNQRDLPWRKKYDPYQVWISEIMLQQTQVTTVLPYFERWMKAVPSIEKVAKAKEEELLKLWEGLGYYRRVKSIQKAAGILVKENSGKMFEDYEKILELPGIGKYSAAAICSIAFNQDYSVVDGNVIRVLSRLTDFRENIHKNRAHFWKLSESLLISGKARFINQALMEFGALQCVPKNPDCKNCPLRSQCEAYKSGTQNNLPNKGPSKSKVPIQVAIAVIRKNGKIFIQKRRDGGLMTGLWEFPGGRVEKNEKILEALHREVAEEVGIGICNVRPIMRIKHSYTKYLVDLHCFLADYEKGHIELRAASRSKWVQPKKLPTYAFPSANVKLIAKLLSVFEPKPKTRD